MPSANRIVIWSADAEEDLFQIWRYLSYKASLPVADRTTRKIRLTCERLRRWPFSGRDRSEVFPGIRSVVSNPHVIFYRIGSPDIEIVRVLHGRRDIEAIFEARPTP